MVLYDDVKFEIEYFNTVARLFCCTNDKHVHNNYYILYFKSQAIIVYFEKRMFSEC